MSSGVLNVSNYGIDQINSYYNLIDQNINLQNMSIQDLESKNQELSKKQEIQQNQLKEIEDKEKLLLTRSRMLQISQDRNSYKKKIIYTLIAAIFLIFILTIVLYVYFKRKLNIPKNKVV
jgi:predicted PurR-regulated permease PerM